MSVMGSESNNSGQDIILWSLARDCFGKFSFLITVRMLVITGKFKKLSLLTDLLFFYRQRLRKIKFTIDKLSNSKRWIL